MRTWIAKNEKLVAIFFLVALASICYLPLSNQTGLYLNDWHPLAGKLNDTSLVEMWRWDRKGVGFLYSLTYPLLGDHLFLWQIFSIGLRMVSSLGLLWIVRLVWKEDKFFSTAVAAIFLVYPGFMEQSIAITFSNHHIGIVLAIFSIFFTIKAIQASRWWVKIGFTVMAVLLELAYLFNYEYMLGYEVVRIILIWYLLYRPFNTKHLWHTLKGVFITALPYIACVGYFLYWRIRIFKSPRPTLDLGLLANSYLSNPLKMGSRVILETIRDSIESTWVAWSVPFNHYVAEAPYKEFAISLGLAVLAGTLFWLLIKFAGFGKSIFPDEAESHKNTPYSDSIWIGLIAILVALLPVILTNREVKFEDQMDRYTLHAILGIALFTTGLIFHWIKDNGRKFILIFLIGIAVVIQFNSTAAYTTWWKHQTNLWWQLSWRAPDIKDGTVVMPLLPSGSRSQEAIEAITPIQAIYRQSPPITITAEVINQDTVLDMLFMYKALDTFRGGITYTREFEFPLIISYPSGGSCAHIIDGSRLELSLKDDSIIHRIARFSQIDRILPNSVSHVPPTLIFGEEPEHDWCYYYQKINLARQQENWQNAAKLSDEAQVAGLTPLDLSEWVPTLEVYLVSGQADKAKQISEYIKQDLKTTQNLCASWLFEKPHANSQVEDMICQEIRGSIQD